MVERKRVSHPNGTMCWEAGRFFFSRGIWNGENPLDFILPIIMFQVIASFVFSWIFYFLLRPLQAPKFVSSCLSGIVLGPSVLGRIPGFMEMFYPDKEVLVLETVAAFAIMYYVLLLVVKLDLTTILKTTRDAWSIGVTSFIIPIFLVLCFSLLIKDSMPGMRRGVGTFLTCATMTANSLSDTVNAMNELNYLTSELGQLATSAAVISEISMWIISLMLTHSGSLQSFQSLAYFVAFSLFVYCMVRPTVLWIVKITPEGKPVNEGFVIALLVVSAMVGIVTDSLGLEVFPGVLLMGLIIPGGPPLGSAVIEKSELLVQEFFLHFLFLCIGRVIDVSQIQDMKELSGMLLLIIVAYIGKFLAVYLGSLYYKMRFRNVLLLGLMLNLKGPIEIIFFIKQFSAKFIDAQMYAMLMLYSLLSTVTAAYLLNIFYRPNVRLGVSWFSRLSMRSFLLAPNGDEFRILHCIHNEDDVPGIISLVQAINPTVENPVSAYVIHALELVGSATPLLAPYRYQTSFRTNSTDRIMRAFTNYSNSTAAVTVLPFTLVAPYKSMHESICRHALDNVAPLIILPFNESHVKNNIRSFNNNMLAFAPSTVGIWVRRKNNNGHHHGRKVKQHSHFSYHVAVIFFGGEDDREALALAYRMSSHPGVSITALRIVYNENQENNRLISPLDEDLCNKFREKNAGNELVRCNEVVVENAFEVVSIVKALPGRYDLVMVGRRPESDANLEEEVGKWTEYSELGVIGDMIASPDFCGDVASVLVLQHHVVGDGSGRISDDTISFVEMERGGSCSYKSILSEGE